MHRINNTASFSFCDMLLDRQSSSRKNDEWLLTELKSKNSKIIPIWKGQFIFKQSALLTVNYKDCLITENQELKELLRLSHLTFLGQHINVVNKKGAQVECSQAIFTVDISSLDVNLLFGDDSNIELLDLRSSLGFINSEYASILGFANNLGYWQRAHRFCGFCGNSTKKIHGGHTVRCTNELCGKDVFPRTDPVVIMLVEYKPKNGPAMCLLAEHHRTPEKVVSTLAGFVDPAETLEQAVVREVKEEAGVNITNVSYVTSQPWPFPSSLMIGFYAEAEDPTITIDDEEIRDAQWFTADEVRSFGDWGDEGDSYKLPRKESISRYLINGWLENNK